MKKIAVIGAGAMGGAFARGIAGLTAADYRMAVATPHPDKVADICRLNGVTVSADNRAAVGDADFVVVAVKPWVLPGVLAEISSAIRSDAEVCLIVAGIKGKDLVAMFHGALPASLSIAMPNTAMTVGESMTFITPLCGSPAVAQELFGMLGQVMVIEERLLPAATALASCGIAYALRYVRAASEGGVQLGFRASQAQSIVAQTLLGTVRLLECPGAHAEVEIDKVTTPGGLTIRGLNAMERAGFSAAVIEGLVASIK